mgnify:CR=1 FL=1
MAEGIRIEKLVKTYGSGDTAVHALRGVDMSVAKGEVVVVDVRRRGGPPLNGATAIPLAALRARLNELPVDKGIVFVDDSGRGGYLAACIAEQHGRDAAYLSGGLRSMALERGAE